MSQLNERKLRFSNAAHAIESTPKSLRKWLQNESVRLVSEGSDGWRDFSYLDIALLAIMRPLVNFGFNVATANKMGFEVLGFFPEIQDLESAGPTTLALVWSNRFLFVWPDADAWEMQVHDKWKELPPLPSAYLVLSIEELLNRAFERASQIVEG